MSDDTKRIIELMEKFKAESDANGAAVKALLDHLKAGATKELIESLRNGGKGDKKLLQLLETMESTNAKRNKTVQEFQSIIKNK